MMKAQMLMKGDCEAETPGDVCNTSTAKRAGCLAMQGLVVAQGRNAPQGDHDPGSNICSSLTSSSYIADGG